MENRKHVTKLHESIMTQFLYILFFLFPLFLVSQDVLYSSLLRQLQSQYQIDRTWARHELGKLSEKHIPSWVESFPKMNYLGKREMVLLVGQFSTEEAVSAILAFLQDKDEGVRNECLLCLLDICSKDTKFLAHVAQIRPESPTDIFWKSFYAKKVEDHLEELLSPNGGLGSYAGQFNDMLYLKYNAVPTLINMLENKGYICVNVRLQKDAMMIYRMRYLAVNALPIFEKYFGDMRTAVFKALHKLVNSSDKDEEQFGEMAKISLYFLGEQQLLLRDIMNLKERISFASNENIKAEYLADLGHLYLRINQEEEGIRFLKNAIEYAPKYGLAYYNLACAYACVGKGEDAMDALESAVQNGYDDLEWMQMDGDLRPLRENPRFKKIVQDLQDKFGINPAKRK